MEERDIGPRLREIRQAKGLRMDDVAAAAGVAQSTLSYIERGGSIPAAGTLRRILGAMGVPWTAFWGEDAPPSPSDDELEPDLDTFLKQGRIQFDGQPLTADERALVVSALRTVRAAVRARMAEEEHGTKT